MRSLVKQHGDAFRKGFSEELTGRIKRERQHVDAYAKLITAVGDDVLKTLIIEDGVR